MILPAQTGDDVALTWELFVTTYPHAPRLLAALGPQALWLHYQCVPVEENSETLYLVGWSHLGPATLEDLSLVFGKVVLQKGTDQREILVRLIKAYAVDQPISDLS